MLYKTQGSFIRGVGSELVLSFHQGDGCVSIQHRSSTPSDGEFNPLYQYFQRMGKIQKDDACYMHMLFKALHIFFAMLWKSAIGLELWINLMQLFISKHCFTSPFLQELEAAPNLFLCAHWLEIKNKRWRTMMWKISPAKILSMTGEWGILKVHYFRVKSYPTFHYWCNCANEVCAAFIEGSSR